MKRLFVLIASLIFVICLCSCSKETYTVSFELNGGELSTQSIEVTYKDGYVLPTPTKFSNKFMGWYNGDELISNYGKWTIQSDVTLNAKWEKSDVIDESGFVYEFENNALTLKDYVGKIGDYAFIPAEYKGYEVIGISDGTFNSVEAFLEGKKEVAFKVYMTRNITEIGENAFKNELLVPIVWDYKGDDGIIYKDNGNSLEVVGYEGTFEEMVTIPYEYNGKPITSIGTHAFYNFQNLIPQSTISVVNFRIAIPKSINYIGKKAFYVCGGVKPVLYYMKNGDTYREIINTQELLTWIDETTFESGNKDVTDVIMLLRPAIGWSRFSNAPIPE